MHALISLICDIVFYYRVIYLLLVKPLLLALQIRGTYFTSGYLHRISFTTW